MIKLAKITHIDSNRVTLKLQKKAQCFDCKSRCADGFLSFLFRNQDADILIVGLTADKISHSHLSDNNNFFQARHKVNDMVGMKFDHSAIVKMACVLYGLPIIVFLIMLLCGYYLFQQLHLNADMGGLVGLITGLFVAKWLISHLQTSLKPHVVFFK